MENHGELYLAAWGSYGSTGPVWGAEGKDAGTLDKFFVELGTERAGRIETVSMDLGPAFLKSVRKEGGDRDESGEVMPLLGRP